MSDAVAKVKKPQLRGLFQSQIKKNLIVAGVLSVIAAFAFKYGVAEPRKKQYADFYRNYDPYKVFEEIRQKGLFQSCAPDK